MSKQTNAEEYILPQIKRHIWHDTKVLNDEDKQKLFAFLRLYHNSISGEIQWHSEEARHQAQAEEALMICSVIEKIITADYRYMSNAHKLGQIHYFIKKLREEHSEESEDIYEDEPGDELL